MKNVEKIKGRLRMFAAAGLLFFALTLCADAARQETVEIKGAVLDKATGEGLGWATVVLRLAALAATKTACT